MLEIFERIKVRIRVYCGIIAVCLSLVACTPNPDNTLHVAVADPLVHRSGETNFVCLTATMPSSNRLGDPIYVDFTLQNNRDVAVRLNHNNTAGDIWMELTTNRREIVPLTDFGKQYDMGDPYEFTHNIPIYLQPHATMRWRYNLLDYFQITKVGQYRLSVVRTVDGTKADPSDGGDYQEVDVGPIRFSVK